MAIAMSSISSASTNNTFCGKDFINTTNYIITLMPVNTMLSFVIIIFVLLSATLPKLFQVQLLLLQLLFPF